VACVEVSLTYFAQRSEQFRRIIGDLAWIFHKKAQTSCKSLIEWEV
jgi:hypothetical protein